MSKRLICVCVLLLTAALTLPAYAAVQNVKISGDVAVRTLVRQNYDLDGGAYAVTTSATGVATAVDYVNKTQGFFANSLGLNVMADLTDNVSVVTRIINQRDWDNNSSGANTFTADVALAYASLREFFFTPLNVDIGRQNLWYGKGFIVGAKLMDPNNSLTAKEYTEISAFDAIRGVIDLEGWKVDLAYAKMDENTVAIKDDLDLYIVNVGHKLGWNNAETEAYWVAKIDDAPQVQGYPREITAPTVSENSVYTLGLRGSMSIPENVLTETVIAGEVAHQTGRYSQVKGTERGRDAWALDLSAEKKFSQVLWKPKAGIEYIYYSGESAYQDADTGTWRAWDPVYRGKFDSAIREFQNYFYATRFRARGVNQLEVAMDGGLTNEKQLLLNCTIYPMKNLTLKAGVVQFWLDKTLRGTDANGVGQKRSKNLGQELDLLLTYDYSSDVSFSLLWGTFFPGKYWLNGQGQDSEPVPGTYSTKPRIATDIVGSVKLSF